MKRTRHSLSPDYAGELARVGPFRVVVAASGERFYLQHAAEDGSWFCVLAWAINRTALRRKLADHGAPLALVDGGAVPEFPDHVALPWSDPDRERAAERARPDYSGVLAVDRKARIAVQADQFGDLGWFVQRERSDGRWKHVAFADTRGDLLAAVQPKRVAGRGYVVSGKLRAVAEAMPERPYWPVPLSEAERAAEPVRAAGRAARGLE